MYLEEYEVNEVEQDLRSVEPEQRVTSLHISFAYNPLRLRRLQS
jgi:hypothetical protein